MKIPKEDIINVKSWMGIGDCNYEIDHADDSTPESGVVYCNIEHIPDFFAKCKRTKNRYVVVSGFSDFGLAYQEEHPVAVDMLKILPFIQRQILGLGYNSLQIPARCDLDHCNIDDKYSIKCYMHTRATLPKIPENIVKWFLVNPMLEDPRIEPIPLGVGKDASQDIFETPLTTDKTGWLYLNWQDHTVERSELKSFYLSTKPYWCTIVTEPKPFKDYLEELSKHVFVLCPEGNGLDCYRILEAIYLGCIPIVKDNPAMAYLENLPVVRVSSWSDINIDFLKNQANLIEQKEYSSNKIKFSFWMEQIEKSRSLL